MNILVLLLTLIVNMPRTVPGTRAQPVHLTAWVTLPQEVAPTVQYKWMLPPGAVLANVAMSVRGEVPPPGTLVAPKTAVVTFTADVTFTKLGPATVELDMTAMDFDARGVTTVQVRN